MATSETAWLIERNGVHICVGKQCGGASLGWVTFTDSGALRFSSKEKAEDFIHHHQLAHLATAVEHSWG